MNKFSHVPIDRETKVLYQCTDKLDDYDISYEVWSWDGIYGESIIFSSEDVSNLNDDEIIKLVLESQPCKQGHPPTLKRSDSGFTFVNFNIEMD